MKNLKRNRENLSDGKGTCKIIFSETFGDKDIKLFEVPDEVLTTICNGESVDIIGEGVEGAVLCTGSATYSIKKVETSNYVFLVPASDSSNFTMDSHCNDYYELSLTYPRIHQLKELLQPTIYRGKQYDEENPPIQDHLFKKSAFFEKVQASGQEINSALTSIHAVEINEFIRLLDLKILYETYKELIDTIIEYNWDIMKISDSLCKQIISTRDEIYLLHALQSLGELETEYWKLNQDKISRAMAHILFHERSLLTQWNPNDLWSQEDFLLTWASRIPGVSISSGKLLEGIAILEVAPISNSSSSSTQTASSSTSLSSYSYRYLPLEELALDTKSRINQLFNIRPKYSLDEIAPYLNDLIGGPGQPKNAIELLLLHSKDMSNAYFDFPENCKKKPSHHKRTKILQNRNVTEIECLLINIKGRATKTRVFWLSIISP
eukprot:gene1712-3314_t